jgi:hypothetical protein
VHFCFVLIIFARPAHAHIAYIYVADEKREVLTERVVIKSALGQNAFGLKLLVKKQRAPFFCLRIAF